MFKSTADILESLATITANTGNLKETVDEMKETFDKHIEKEEFESRVFSKKIESIEKSVADFECPNHRDIEKIERRVLDSEKQDEGRRRSDREAKKKEVQAQADKDKKIAADIASLQATRKYNYITASGIYIILAAVLKKLFA